MKSYSFRLFIPLLGALLLGIMLIAPAQAAPERIVSVDGALTEIVHALGEADRLVGVDTTSMYPPEMEDLPQIGYKRALSVEGILSLNPDMVLLTDDAGPEKVIMQLQRSDVKLQTLPEEPTLEAVRSKILGVAGLLGKVDQGEALWQQIDQELAAARSLSKQVEKPIKVLFVLSLSDRSPLVAGRNTHADTMIRLAGGINVIDSFEGYKPISPEAVAMTKADVVLMMDQRNHATTAEHLFQQPGFAHLPAARDQRLIKQDGLLMLGFGPRIGQAVRQLHNAFYPAPGEASHVR